MKQIKKTVIRLNKFKRFGSYNTVAFLIGMCCRHCTSPGVFWENNRKKTLSSVLLQHEKGCG